jgi:t-SNARE complex subunit (syntaxin)
MLTWSVNNLWSDAFGAEIFSVVALNPNVITRRSRILRSLDFFKEEIRRFETMIQLLSRN